MREMRKRCSCGKKATSSVVVLTMTINRPNRQQASSARVLQCDECAAVLQSTQKRLKARSPASRVLRASAESRQALEVKLAELAQ